MSLVSPLYKLLMNHHITTLPKITPTPTASLTQDPNSENLQPWGTFPFVFSLEAISTTNYTIGCQVSSKSQDLDGNPTLFTNQTIFLNR